MAFRPEHPEGTRSQETGATRRFDAETDAPRGNESAGRDGTEILDFESEASPPVEPTGGWNALATT